MLYDLATGKRFVWRNLPQRQIPVSAKVAAPLRRAMFLGKSPPSLAQNLSARPPSPRLRRALSTNSSHTELTQCSRNQKRMRRAWGCRAMRLEVAAEWWV